VDVRPFAIERFYERWEFRAELMLSSSDCESLAVADVLALEPGAREPADVLGLAAAEEGILVAYHALLGAGEHAVIETPCYGSALELVRSTGAEVSEWRRRYEDGWAHDVDELERLLRPDTRLLYINSPHNPTGRAMSHEVFARVVELAREHSLVLFSDEVYRGLEHDDADRLPAAVDAYERAISLGAVSKAHGLPGLRVAWLAARDPALLARVRDMKLYTTICSPAPSELLVALALRHGDRLIARSRELVLANMGPLEEFLARRAELFEWVRPNAGPIGFPRVRAEVEVEPWCEQIAERAGVLLLPGVVYGQPRHVRMGFGRANLAQAIERLDGYLG